MLYAGTSGYSFKEWVGPFYPPKTPGKKYLSFYASRLRTVEINYTFRHFPTRDRSRSWAAETPESFKFSLKMHQSVTHVARLNEVWPSVRDFLSALGPLGPRIGAILFQLPPYFPVDLERLGQLLKHLPEDRQFAFEFRHPSWSGQNTSELLRQAGVALCATETDLRKEPPPLTATYSYIRLREPPPFSEEQLSFIRKKVRRVLKKADDLYFYVKHDPMGLSPALALQIQSLEK